METRSEIVATSNALNSRARQYQRAVYSVPIHVRMLMAGGVRKTRGITLDVSEGGMGALMQNELKVGDVVQIELSLPKQELTAVAIVRHSSITCSGFEFLGLTSGERQQLADMVAGTQAHSQFGNA